MSGLEVLQKIAEIEYRDIVAITFRIDYKLRIVLNDNSFIDVNVSQKLKNKFGFHWECKGSARRIFRYDNFPDIKWNYVSTFPYHFHDGSDKDVIESPFPEEIIPGFRAFMDFVRKDINKLSS